MSSPNYVSLDHSRSFAGEADWVQAEPLEKTLLPSRSKPTATVILLHVSTLCLCRGEGHMLNGNRALPTAGLPGYHLHSTWRMFGTE